MLLALLSAGERREEGGAATKRRRRSSTKSASSSSSACASAAADPAQSDSAEDKNASGSENMLSGQRSDEDKSEEDKSEAEGEDSNSEDELSSSGSAASVEYDKMVCRVSTAEIRCMKKIHDDPLKFAQMKGDLLFARPSCFRDSVGFLYLVDMLGAARGHRPFVSLVDQLDDDWGDYSALLLQVVKDAPRLPDDWSDSLVVVGDFGDSILVATRTGKGASILRR
jgi:hypothetical protein